MARDLVLQRQQLIRSLRRAGVYDERVLTAMMEVPRELFVDQALTRQAYTDLALPIGMGQTISQPLIVALMTQALRLNGHERVLEIGTGSGYQTAILAKLSSYVYSIERYSELAYLAACCLTQIGVQNVSIYIGDGSRGWLEQSPYDRIIVTAAAPDVPPQFLEQLVPGGILVIPVGGYDRQDLQVIQRLEGEIRVQSLGSCIFVPLVGEEGWKS
jgi:protein-L-isoaspartate(D-aspartate) O-methyltransferase